MSRGVGRWRAAAQAIATGSGKASQTAGNKMDDPTVKKPEVTPSGGRKTPSRPRHMTIIDWETYRWLIDTAGISNLEMARATGMSESYAAGVSSGMRVRVNVDFVNRAAAYIAARMSEPMVIVRMLMAKR